MACSNNSVKPIQHNLRCKNAVFLGLKMSDTMEVESSPKETPKEETSPKVLQEAEVDEMKKYV